MPGGGASISCSGTGSGCPSSRRGLSGMSGTSRLPSSASSSDSSASARLSGEAEKGMLSGTL